MLKNLEVRKFIAIVLVISYIVLLGFLVIFGAVSGRELQVSVEFVAFSSMVSLIVGAYFGKSTMAEGAKMNKDP